ncbi:hypothetical protein B7435_27435 [Mycolicibacterium peregrinum]|nr:hypothetical protein B7435_27435 [Mycolicibacterium peregrinum]
MWVAHLALVRRGTVDAVADDNLDLYLSQYLGLAPGVLDEYGGRSQGVGVPATSTWHLIIPVGPPWPMLPLGPAQHRIDG